MRATVCMLFVIFAFSCGNKKEKSVDQTPSESMDQTSTPVESPASSVSLDKIWETSGLKTAESVLFDEIRGVYYVSCIGEVPPTSEDNDGFIATLDQKGKIINNAFAVNLDAPKGMAVNEKSLFVTDINEFVEIDLTTGDMRKMSINGAKFLNDVAIAPDGVVYFTDMNTNTIYTYKDQKLGIFIKDDNLNNPNGIYVDDETITVVSYSSGDINTIDIASKVITKRAENAVPGGDGVEPWKGGFLISNWNGEVYYTDSDWKSAKMLDTKDAKMNAADIGINRKSGELLVPTFFGNSVVAYKIGE